MSVKKKLIIILSIMGLILGLFASIMVWNAAVIVKEVRSVGPALDHLRMISETRTSLYRQIHDMMHYLVYGEEYAKSDFKTLGNEIKKNLQKLDRLRLRKKILPENDEDKLSEVASLEEAYDVFLTGARRTFYLRDLGKTFTAATLAKEETETFIDDRLFGKIDAIAEGEIDEIEAAYRKVLMRSGFMPWIGGRSLRLVEIAQASIRYYLAADKAARVIHAQIKELMDYLVSGDNEDRREFEEYSLEVGRTFEQWGRTVQFQKRLGVEGEEADQRLINTVERRYSEMLGLAEKAIELRKAGGAKAAFRFVEDNLKFLIDNVLFSTVDAVIYDSREEIVEAHRGLLKASIYAGVAGIAAVGLVFQIIFSVSFGVIRGMISSLGKLKEETELIRKGDLNHRIDVNSGDEFGDLASSFNRMTQALQESSEELKSFVYIVSHDLRAPLVNIKGFSGELHGSLKEMGALLGRCISRAGEKERAEASALLEKDIPEAMGFINSSADRMDGLINSLLKLSRIGRRELKLEAIDMNSLVHELLKTYAHQIEQNKAAVTVGALPETVADRTSMEQIMGNLLDNAVKYLEPARTGELNISGELTSSEAVFHVRDNGRGIAQDDIPKVFEVFRRAGGQDVPGEGMGLAYVRTMVKRHGGRIWCESEAGKGSTFSFSIPSGKEIDY